MKNIFLIIIATLIILLGLIGFNYYKNLDNKTKVNEIDSKDIIVNEDEKEKEEKNKEEKKKIPLGLYIDEKNNRKLVKEYETNWQYHDDIAVFSVFYTNEEEITNTLLHKIFDNYKEGIEDINNYKIGYKIEFNTSEKNINKVIISPKDTEDFYNYLEIYLYDDYHRKDGEWYSHTTENDYNENTILTSIKLTSGKEVNAITSSIKLTTFLYRSDEPIDNNYLGNNSYNITINKTI